MAVANIKKVLDEMSLKIAEHGVAEAEAKREKAELERETARLQHEHIRKLIEAEEDAYGMFTAKEGRLKS